MLRYLNTNQLDQFPKLSHSMFRDRATQFKHRLDWDVDVDENGFEHDEYDHQNPIYAIWVLPDGSHGGSMRILPTLGKTMVNDHFADIIGSPIRDRDIWESTRFCLAPHIKKHAIRISAAIMLAGCEIGLNFNLRKAVAVYDPRMVRVYKKLGWPPKLLGASGTGKHRICVGTWEFDPATRMRMAHQAGVSVAASQLWFRRSFCEEYSKAA